MERNTSGEAKKKVKLMLNEKGDYSHFLFAIGLVSAGAAAPTLAHADDLDAWHVVVHVRSWHASHPAGVRWNEKNRGLGLRRDVSDDWSVQTGAYRNSLKETSALVLADWSAWRSEGWSLGGFAGVVAGGYEASVKAAAGLFARFEFRGISGTLRLFPKPPPSKGSTVHRTALTALEFSWHVK